MYNVTLDSLYHMDYSAYVINSLRQKWVNSSFNCIGNPKKQHLFIYFYNCNAKYVMADGKEIYAQPGNLVYIPEGCEYNVDFLDCDCSEDFNVIATNFKLFDSDNKPFRFNECVKPYSFSKTMANTIEPLFVSIADNFQNPNPSPAKIKSVFYELLYNMSADFSTKKNILPKYSIISKGIHIIENENIANWKIEDIASTCNVSPVYFRKLFKDYSGVSPMEYKINSMISLAKKHLLYSNSTINEIALTLGFDNTAYFCRIFKKKTGMTPTQYKTKNRQFNEPLI